MATLCRRGVKLVATVSAVPVLGLGLRAVHAEESTSKQDGKAPNRTFRACELPVYNDKSSNNGDLELCGEVYPRNAVEEQIGNVRKAVWGVVSTGKTVYDTVEEKVNIGIEHTSATVDFLQSNPAEFSRYAFIAVAGMGGVILGYRGGILMKIVFSSIAIGSSTALCYPKAAMDVSSKVSDEAGLLWKQVGGKDLVDQYWPFGDKKEDAKSEAVPKSASTEKKQIKTDPGQSNPNDKDMYSTRS